MRRKASLDCLSASKVETRSHAPPYLGFQRLKIEQESRQILPGPSRAPGRSHQPHGSYTGDSIPVPHETELIAVVNASPCSMDGTFTDGGCSLFSFRDDIGTRRRHPASCRARIASRLTTEVRFLMPSSYPLLARPGRKSAMERLGSFAKPIRVARGP